MTLNKFVLTISLLSISAGILASNTLVFQNTRGSTLNLQISPDNTLSGTFTSAVASKECPQAIGMKRPIVGFWAKNALSISVSYPECGVTNLIGNMEKDKHLIDATFIVAHESQDSAKEGPGARMIGHDIFHRIK